MIKVFRNEPLVRTRYASITLILSESAHHSDSLRINYTKPVGISLPFGLVTHQLHQTCRNQLTIRTRYASITPILSESAYHSDSLHINYTNPVDLTFGLVTIITPILSESAIIRTRYASITQSCRNQLPFGLVTHQLHQSSPN